MINAAQGDKRQSTSTNSTSTRYSKNLRFKLHQSTSTFLKHYSTLAGTASRFSGHKGSRSAYAKWKSFLQGIAQQLRHAVDTNLDWNEFKGIERYLWP
jgi:hypothetical protein